MGKYIIARTFCDDEEAEIPDVFILGVNASRYAAIAQLVQATTGFAALTTPQMKAVEYEYVPGFWLTTGDSGWVDRAIGRDNDIGVVDLEDIMAIVGDDTLNERLVVDRDGDFKFTCIHHDSKMRLRTELMDLEMLGKALEV